jgi:hemerythrin
MTVEWKPEMSVGIGEVDVQHRKIIGKLKELSDALEKKEEPETAAGILKFLAVYIEEHFRTEEMFMLKYIYPDFKEHQDRHLGFLKRITRLYEELSEGSIKGDDIYNESIAVYNWFVLHIENTDKKMGAFLRGKIR